MGFWRSMGGRWVVWLGIDPRKCGGVLSRERRAIFVGSGKWWCEHFARVGKMVWGAMNRGGSSTRILQFVFSIRRVEC